MEKCLLSVDWDYFICTRIWGSCMETSKSLVDFWYKRYLQAKARGEDFERSFALSPTWRTFWDQVRQRFAFAKDAKAWVSDSHALSYRIARKTGCKRVLLFDAHADLGYGGLLSLDFEVNCSNWLGKLLKEGQVENAHIFYSPFTQEKPEYFKQMNSAFSIRYCGLESWKDGNAEVSAIHICRSGAWTPPWLDRQFERFVEDLGIPVAVEDCPERKWDPSHITLADKIDYLMA